MTRTPNLTVVGKATPAPKRTSRARGQTAPAEQTPPPQAGPQPMTVAAAAASSSRRALLIATRDRIARAIDDPRCPPRDLSSLTRRLLETVKELEAIEPDAGQEGDRGGTVPDEAFDASAI